MYILRFFLNSHLFTLVQLALFKKIFNSFSCPWDCFALSWLKWLLIYSSCFYILCNYCLPRVQSVWLSASVCMPNLGLTHSGWMFRAFWWLQISWLLNSILPQFPCPDPSEKLWNILLKYAFLQKEVVNNWVSQKKNIYIYSIYDQYMINCIF